MAFLKAQASTGTFLGGSVYMNSNDSLLATYLRYRELNHQLQKTILDTLSKAELLRGAQNLGLRHGDGIQLRSQAASEVLLEYCIYELRQGGLNAVERYIHQNPPVEGTEKGDMLRAMAEAQFRVMVVESLEPGLGFRVRDIFDEEALFISDVGLSHSGEPGLLMGARIVTVSDVSLTTGSALPIAVFPEAERSQWIQKFAESCEGRFPVEAFIRAAFAAGIDERIGYANPSDPAEDEPADTVVRSKSRVGRNDPCPCGSGKKFKACCMRR